MSLSPLGCSSLMAALSITVLAACSPAEVAERPAAMTLTPEAAGHYCQMNVLEHPGPKAQIHRAGQQAPIWFTQVRDAVAFTRLPEEPKDWTAIYVNDMARAPSWQEPGADNWIEAREAFFVVGSRQAGGMGAPEAIPFRTRAEALAFTAREGGSVLRFDEIPTDYVLAAVDDTEALAEPKHGPEALQ